MTDREIRFNEFIEQHHPGVVSLTGGGGKTSLLFALAAALSEGGRSVLCTTTTKMLLPAESDRLAVAVGTDPSMLPRVAGRPLFAAGSVVPDTVPVKVAGYRADEVDALHRRGTADWILVEADGAAGKPLKAPAAHEPVIPADTVVAVAVIGLRCVGQTLNADIAFRLEELSAVTGLAEGDRITPAALARLAAHPMGMFKSVPPTAIRCLFCNRADIPGAEAEARELAAELSAMRPTPVGHVFLGSLLTKGLRCLALPIA